MFTSRADAGRKLGRWLWEQGLEAELVAGLPRGGVVVAAEVARVLGLPLEVLVVRKIGHPWHREYAVGALAEGGVVVLDQGSLAADPLAGFGLEGVIREEQKRLRAYQSGFHSARGLALGGKAVVLVDDGLATGATMEAAVLSAQKMKARRVIIASPVGSTTAVDRLKKLIVDLRILQVEANFEAVGRYYETFSQTTDEEVIELLKAGQAAGAQSG